MNEMTKYLEPTDAGAFADIDVKAKPPEGFDLLCPKCKGHGGWNLKLNAYGAGKHFQMMCGACWGWGYLVTGQTCAHEWGGVVTDEDRALHGQLFRCQAIWKCKLCEYSKVVDSSD